MNLRSPADIPQTLQQVFRSRNSRFYHQQSCNLGSEVHEKNRQYFTSIAAAELTGLRPCRMCAATAIVRRSTNAHRLLPTLPEDGPKPDEVNHD